mgnify:FL=1
MRLPRLPPRTIWWHREVGSWVAKYREEHATDQDREKTSEAAEIAKLRAEVRELRQENESLKKQPLGLTGLLGVFRALLVLCFRPLWSSPGACVPPRSDCDILGLNEGGYDCAAARSTRQYP